MEHYSLASTTWDQLEIEAIHSVIASGHFTMGPRVKEFEEEFAKFFGAKYAVMSNSGSSANLLAFAALHYSSKSPMSQGRSEVIVPAVSWSTTYYPVTQLGYTLKFVDIDALTLNMNLQQTIDAIDEKTAAIFAVNLLGNPSHLNELAAAAETYGIPLLEDNCESMGASVGGKYAGSHGLIGTFSCFFSHHISTMEGGMVVTDDEELFHIMLSLRAHGWTRNLPKDNLVCGTKSDDPFEESFRFVLPGYNVRPLELAAAIERRERGAARLAGALPGTLAAIDRKSVV